MDGGLGTPCRSRQRESTAIVQFRRVEPIFLSADPIGLRKHYA